MIFQYSAIMCRIIAANLPLAPRLRGRFYEKWKNNLSFASPSIRCPTSQGSGTKALLSQLDSDNSVLKSGYLEKIWAMEMDQDMRLEKCKKQIQHYWDTLSNMYETKYKDNGADKAEE